MRTRRGARDKESGLPVVIVVISETKRHRECAHMFKREKIKIIAVQPALHWLWRIQVEQLQQVMGPEPAVHSSMVMKHAMKHGSRR